MTAETTSLDTAGFFDAIFGTTCVFIYIAIIVLMIVGMWKLYEKAGKPGWASLIPIYNVWVLLEIAGRPGWWILLLFIPFANVVIWIIVALDLAKSFGKDTLWGIGLILFPEIFYLILGFGSARYEGPAAGR